MILNRRLDQRRPADQLFFIIILLVISSTQEAALLARRQRLSGPEWADGRFMFSREEPAWDTPEITGSSPGWSEEARRYRCLTSGRVSWFYSLVLRFQLFKLNLSFLIYVHGFVYICMNRSLRVFFVLLFLFTFHRFFKYHNTWNSSSSKYDVAQVKLLHDCLI